LIFGGIALAVGLSIMSSRCDTGQDRVTQDRTEWHRTGRSATL